MTAAPFRSDLLSAFETSYGANLIGCTITRIRGIISVDTPTNNNEPFVVAVRVGDASDLAGATVSSENPSAGGQAADWMLYEPMAPSTAASRGDLGTARLVDVRAKRRIDELGDALLLYAGGAATAAGTVNLMYTLSILVALP